MESNPVGYQMMAQLMLSHHVMTDDEAYGWYEKLRQYDEQGQFNNMNNDNDGNGNGSGNVLGFEQPASSLEEEDARSKGEIIDAIWTKINHTLKPFFGLEIATAVIGGVRYHSMINTQQDEVIRLEDTFSKRYNAHDRAFIRLLLNKFVDAGNEDEEEEESEDEDDDEDDDDAEELDVARKKKSKTKEKKKKKKMFALQRNVCINTRSELSNNFKLSLEQAGRVVDALLDDKYLRPVMVAESDDGDDDDDDDDDDHDDGIIDASQQSQRRQRRNGGKRRKKNNTPTGRESGSMQLELAPRAFLELSHVLTDDYGMNSHQLPQFLYHRD